MTTALFALGLLYWTATMSFIVFIVQFSLRYWGAWAGRIQSAIWTTTFIVIFIIPFSPFLIPYSVTGRLHTIHWLELNGWVILLIWGIGALIQGVRLLRSWMNARTLRKTSQMILCRDWIQDFDGLRRTMFLGNSVILQKSDAVTSPLLAGLIHPQLLLPSDFARESSLSERKAVLAHELAHVHRYDLIVHYAVQLMSVIFWFWPPFWILQKHLYDEQDRACDEYSSAVMGGCEAYAESLVSVAKRNLKADKPDLSLAFSHTPSGLRGRIERLLNQDESKFARVSLKTKAVLVCCSLFVLYVSGLVGQAVMPTEIVSPNNIFFKAVAGLIGESAQNGFYVRFVESHKVYDDEKPASFQIAFNQVMNAPTSESLTMRGSMSGDIQWESTSKPSQIFSIQPLQRLFPGECIEVSLTSQWRSMAGFNLDRCRIWRFWAPVLQRVERKDIVQSVVMSDADTQDVLFGDMNNDGWLDLVSINKYASNTVHLNNGSGKFESKDIFSFGNLGDASVDAELADFNGDGFLDVAVANDDRQANYVYINIGDGKRFTQKSFGVPGSTKSLTAADLDGDGDVDLSTGEFEEFVHSVFLNDGDGEFVESKHIESITEVLAVSSGDVDGDGDVDLVYGTKGWENNYIFLNDGDGKFSKRIEDFVYGGIERMKIADMNRDGYLDIICRKTYPDGNDIDSIEINYNRGDGVIRRSDCVALIPEKLARDVRDFCIGDINGDGFLDIIVAVDDERYAVYQNVGESKFPSNQFTPTWGKNVWDSSSIAVGDVNNDGDLEIVVGFHNLANLLIH